MNSSARGPPTSPWHDLSSCVWWTNMPASGVHCDGMSTCFFHCTTLTWWTFYLLRQVGITDWGFPLTIKIGCFWFSPQPICASYCPHSRATCWLWESGPASMLRWYDISSYPPSIPCMMKRHWAPIFFHEQICHFATGLENLVHWFDAIPYGLKQLGTKQLANTVGNSSSVHLTWCTHNGHEIGDAEEVRKGALYMLWLRLRHEMVRCHSLSCSPHISLMILDDESYSGFRCRQHIYLTIHALPEWDATPCFVIHNNQGTQSADKTV